MKEFPVIQNKGRPLAAVLQAAPTQIKQTNTIPWKYVSFAPFWTQEFTVEILAFFFKTAARLGRELVKGKLYCLKSLLPHCSPFLVKSFLGYYNLFTVFKISDIVDPDKVSKFFWFLGGNRLPELLSPLFLLRSLQNRDFLKI